MSLNPHFVMWTQFFENAGPRKPQFWNSGCITEQNSIVCGTLYKCEGLPQNHILDPSRNVMMVCTQKWNDIFFVSILSEHLAQIRPVVWPRTENSRPNTCPRFNTGWRWTTSCASTLYGYKHEVNQIFLNYISSVLHASAYRDWLWVFIPSHFKEWLTALKTVQHYAPLKIWSLKIVRVNVLLHLEGIPFS